MSQENTPTPPAPPPPVKSAKKPRRWRKRTLWTLGILFVIALILRIVAVAMLPTVLRHVAASYGLTASYDRLELYFIAGDAGIWHFQLAPKDGGKPVMESSYARLDLSPYDLLLGRLNLYRLEAENVDLDLLRQADGTIPLLQKFMSASAASASTATTQPIKNIDFTSPLKIDAFRLTNVHAHIVDESAAPTLDTNVTFNLMLTNLNSRWWPARLTLDLNADPFLDVLHVEGTGKGSGKDLDAQVKVQLRGLHARPLAGYLAPFGLKPVAHNLTLTMDAGVKTWASPSDPNGVAAKINLGNITALVDGEPAANVQQMQIDADAIDFANAKIAQVLLDGASLQTFRSSLGALGAVGFELASPTTRPSKVESPAVFHWSVGKVQMHNASAGWVDRAVAPPAKLGFNVVNLSLGALSSELQPAGVPFSGDFAAPGVADTIHVQGQLAPFADVQSADLQFDISGIKPTALQPYLDPWGLGVIYQSGTLTGSLHAQAVVDAKGKIRDGQLLLSNLALKDPGAGNGAGDLLDVSKVQIDGAGYDPKANRISLDAITINGPHLNAARVADTFTLLGLRTQEKVARRPLDENGDPVPVRSSPPLKLADYPKLRIGKLTWNHAGAVFTDQAAGTAMQIDDAGVELTNLSVDLSRQSLLTENGTIHAWLASPGVAGMLDMTGTIKPQARGAGAEISVIVNGQQLAPWRLMPYLPKLPFAFTLQNGGLYLEATTVLHLDETGLGGKLNVKQLSYKDGNQELLGLKELALDSFTLSRGKLELGKLQVIAPQLHATRDADGSIVTCGIMVPMNKNSPATTQPTAPPSPDQAKFVISLPELDIQSAGIWLDDLAVTPAASAHLVASVNVKNLAYGADVIEPCAVQIDLHEDSAIDRVTASGSVVPSPRDPSVNLLMAGEGLRIGKFAGYLPPGISVDLSAGRFSAALDAAAHIDPAGWFGGHVYLNDLVYADFNESLAKFKSLRLSASQVAVDGVGPIALDEFSVADLQTKVTMSKDRAIHGLGISYLGKTATANPAAAQPFVPAPDVAAVNTAALVRNLTWKHSLFSLGKLDIQLASLSLDDQADLGKPIVLSNFHIYSPEKIALLGDEYWACPPVELELTGEIQPMLQSVDVTARIAPFAVPATIALDAKLAGIRGQGITDLLPVLQSQLDGNGLTDGVLTCHLDGTLDQKRIDPLKLDLSKPFDLSFDLKPLAFTTSSGQKLAGVEEIAAYNVRVAPADSTCTIKTLAISNPVLTVYRDAAGIHAAGFTVKLPRSMAAARPVAAAPLVAIGDRSLNGEVRLDRLLITGLDMRAEDRLVNPPLVVPLTGLDFEARGLSTRLPYEDKSLKFTLLVNSASVPMPNPKTGVIETRDVFSQIEASGLVSLYPKPKGWIKTTVDGFDLASLSSEAKENFGIDLRNGIFDGQVDIKMNGDGYLDTTDHFSLTDLDMHEADHGPVQKFLKLAVGLNGLIPVITDDTNAITIPAKIRINANDLTDIDGIGGSLGGAVMSIFTKAVAAAPAKVLGLADSKRKPVPPVVVAFRPGGSSISSDDAAALANLAQQMRDHEELVVTLHTDLTEADVAVVRALANPSREYLLQMASQLRADGWQLFRAHVETKEKAQAQLATGADESASPALAELHQIDRQIAANQEALDDVYALLAPGADKQAPRRTKRASLQLGEGRLQAVLELLTAAQIPDAANRIKLTHATAKPSAGAAGGTVTVTPTWQKKQD